MKPRGLLQAWTRLPFALLILMLAVGGAAQAADSATPVMDRIQARGQLIVGMSGDMPPLNMTDKDGAVIGFEADMAKLLAGAMGVELEIRTLPFNELIGALVGGEVDMVMSGMTMIPARNLKVAFVGPYLRSGKAVLTKVETLARIKDFGQLNDPARQLVALRGSTSASLVQELAPLAQLRLARDTREAIDLVVKDQAQAMIADYTTAIVALLQNPDAGLISVITPITYEPLGIALPSNDALLINWTKNTLASFRASGQTERLERRWFSNAAWLDRLP
jgi:polar amino acid transport system substrate-binding protein